MDYAGYVMDTKPIADELAEAFNTSQSPIAMSTVSLSPIATHLLATASVLGMPRSARWNQRAGVLVEVRGVDERVCFSGSCSAVLTAPTQYSCGIRNCVQRYRVGVARSRSI